LNGIYKVKSGLPKFQKKSRCEKFGQALVALLQNKSLLIRNLTLPTNNRVLIYMNDELHSKYRNERDAVIKNEMDDDDEETDWDNQIENEIFRIIEDILNNPTAQRCSESLPNKYILAGYYFAHPFTMNVKALMDVMSCIPLSFRPNMRWKNIVTNTICNLLKNKKLILLNETHEDENGNLVDLTNDKASGTKGDTPQHILTEEHNMNVIRNICNNIKVTTAYKLIISLPNIPEERVNDIIESDNRIKENLMNIYMSCLQYQKDNYGFTWLSDIEMLFKNTVNAFQCHEIEARYPKDNDIPRMCYVPNEFSSSNVTAYMRHNLKLISLHYNEKQKDWIVLSIFK
jgi:hypothetical protein